MMKHLSAIISRHWVWVLVAWAVVVVGTHCLAPRWDDVTLDGDFAYLPEQMTSVRGERLLEVAFPEKLTKSQVVLVVARRDGKLTGDDYAVADQLSQKYGSPQGDEGPVVGVWDHATEIFGQKFVSPLGANGQATLVVLQLRSEFMAIGNMDFVRAIYAEVGRLRAAADFPKGLQVGVTGAAALGADMLISAEKSINNTEVATILFVLVILLVVYRAPGLGFIPLASIAVSVLLAQDLVAGCTQIAQAVGIDFHIFKTTKIFLIVILYGSGTDYCLFLISRYREELQQGLEPREAIAHALSQVGSALAGSAMTTIFGLGMMFFADFGKFRNSGPAIALALVVTLTASMTLAPAILRGLGLAVFWPFGVGRPRTLASDPTEATGSSAAIPGDRWDWLARTVIARPGLILVVSFLAMAPLAYKGLRTTVSYDLVNELREDCPSVEGLQLLRRHFFAGETGPVTVLAHQSDARFGTAEGQAQIARLTKYLFDLTYKTPAGTKIRPLLSVRSLTEPLGSAPGTFNPLSKAGRQKIAVLKHPRTKATFLSQTGPYLHTVTRFDLVLQFDPFSRESVAVLDYVERQLRVLGGQSVTAAGDERSDAELLHELGVMLTEKPDQDLETLIQAFPSQQQTRVRTLSDELTQGSRRQLLALAKLSADWYGASFDLVGITAGIRDLEAVVTSDQSRIRLLVVLAVLAVVFAILRNPVISVFLILSVLFSYFVTIGLTEWFFGWFWGDTFRGLDWKVPLFLFVLLIAIGEDYNIYLVTRVLEEQRKHGPLPGLRRALVYTGGIITSCGLIMAGTFISMITGTLRAILELGVSLSFGVLLDTMIIRTILVPAFIALYEKYRAWRRGDAETSTPASSQNQAVDLSLSGK